ncbi:hypothetical protein KFK09_022855 [Dendrobium nobile]|uniref:Uncharacterized protein n=1 Tax=Dendrobium nobile TaxID=94219 RepID=A0A8T3AR16_DENNO|nr:hypothetical protein KFK09_022855 [Dendrobium nobile]
MLPSQSTCNLVRSIIFFVLYISICKKAMYLTAIEELLNEDNGPCDIIELVLLLMSEPVIYFYLGF